MKILKHITLFATLLSITISCNEKEEEIQYILPTCSITSPKEFDEFLLGDTIYISANAEVSVGSIVEVAYYINCTYLSSSSTYPYTVSWNTEGEDVGAHIIKAISVGNEGIMTDNITIILDEIIDGIVVDYDGNTYATKKIGTQWWMIENLKTTHYANGVAIDLVEDSAAWSVLSDYDKAYCYYNNSSEDAEIYGALYNWSAAMNGTGSSYSLPSGIQGVCPDGWHLPSVKEWDELISYLGGSEIAGGKMKHAGTTYWNSPNKGATNSSEFNALPAGIRESNGSFFGIGKEAKFWSTTGRPIDLQVYSCNLHSDSTEVLKFLNKLPNALSVRCVKD
jgi:uncharacterized protein (TIGR02145 family)